MVFSVGLDLIRVCAIFFVIAGRFFSLNTSFRVVPFAGSSMFVQSMMNTPMKKKRKG